MYAKKINELKAERATLVENGKAMVEEGRLEELDVLNGKIESLNNSITSLERLQENSKGAAVDSGIEGGAGSGRIEVKEKVRPFNSLGEQLKAVFNVARYGVSDERLQRINNAVAGSSEGVPADGGFALQEDFAGTILETAASTGEILKRVDSYTCSASSNSARWVSIDETDVSTSVFGGVQMYWTSEGATVNATKPKFKEMKLDLEKMMGLAYATDELLQDTAFMTGFFGTAFTVATTRLLEGDIIAGDGTGKPLGILNSNAMISVNKESGQTAKTVTAENLLAIYNRVGVKNRKNMVWLMHPDVEMLLPKMYLKLGTDSVPVWMPSGGISGSQYQTVWNHPIIFDDNCSALGDRGDVIAADLGQYMLLKKGSAKQDWSMHVEFLTDQMCFRLVLRCNGAPKVDCPIKIKNSTLTRSPFVTLDARTGA